MPREVAFIQKQCCVNIEIKIEYLLIWLALICYTAFNLLPKLAMADRNTDYQNREIFELKLINSLLMKELSKSYRDIHSSYSNSATVEITQLKKLNSILVKELAESRNEIDKLKQENEILKSEQGSKSTSKIFQSFDNLKNRKRKNSNSSTNTFEIPFPNPTTKNDFENDDRDDFGDDDDDTWAEQTYEDRRQAWV